MITQLQLMNIVIIIIIIIIILSYKRHDFRKNVIEHKMFVLIFTTNFVCETFLILERISDISVCIDLHTKYALFLSDFNETWIFADRFSKKYSYIKFHENTFIDSRVVPCGWMDRQRDMTKLVFALRNSANAPKNTLRGHNVGSLNTKAGRIHRKQSALRTQRLILKITQLYYVSCQLQIVIRIRILIVFYL